MCFLFEITLNILLHILISIKLLTKQSKKHLHMPKHENTKLTISYLSYKYCQHLV